jgi:PAH dioxygenase small subunit
VTLPPRVAPAPDGAKAVVLDALLLRASVQEFLELEASLLDTGRFEEWLGLLTEDVVYRVPVRVTRRVGATNVVSDMFHFDENRQSLGLRVRRLGTGVAWAEDPPSCTRRFITNVRVQPHGVAEDEVLVTSYLLLYRSRGDDGSHDLVSAERHDVLRDAGDGWRLCGREVLVDQTTLGTKNLAVFL